MPLPQNLAGGEVKGSDPVPAGTYKGRLAKIEAFDPDEARAQGKKTDAQHASLRPDWVIQDEGEMFGRHIFDNLTLAPGKAFMLRKFLDAIAWPDDKPVFEDGVFVGKSDMLDAQVILVVEVEAERTDPNTGNTYEARNRVKNYISVFG
jgi:hypothetical protein